MRGQYDPSRTSRAKEALTEVVTDKREQNSYSHYPRYSASYEDVSLDLYEDLIVANEQEPSRDHVMADSLIQARQHIDTLKRTADQVTSDQQKLINKLLQDLKVGLVKRLNCLAWD